MWHGFLRFHICVIGVCDAASLSEYRCHLQDLNGLRLIKSCTALHCLCEVFLRNSRSAAFFGVVRFKKRTRYSENWRKMSYFSSSSLKLHFHWVLCSVIAKLTCPKNWNYLQKFRNRHFDLVFCETHTSWSCTWIVYSVVFIMQMEIIELKMSLDCVNMNTVHVDCVYMNTVL